MKTMAREGKAEPPMSSLVSWHSQRYGGLGFGKLEVNDSRERLRKRQTEEGRKPRRFADEVIALRA